MMMMMMIIIIIITIKIRDATAMKTQDRLKWLLEMAVQGALWLTKRLPSNLISVFLTGFR